MFYNCHECDTKVSNLPLSGSHPPGTKSQNISQRHEMGWCESREKVSLTDNMRGCHQRLFSGSLRVIRKGQIGDLTRIFGAFKAHLDALNNIGLCMKTMVVGGAGLVNLFALISFSSKVWSC